MNDANNLSDGVPDDEGKALPAGLCYVCQQPARDDHAVDELRAEVERLRAESERRRRYLLATLQQENEVRRDLADLRASIAHILGSGYGSLADVYDDLRALLAEPDVANSAPEASFERQGTGQEQADG